MKSKGTFLWLSLFLVFILGLSPSTLAGQKVTYIVKEGDTLWSICDHYYGDPFLWPELWEMNKFITNPHWISPGDEITLLEYEEKKEEPEPKPVKIVAKPKIEKQPAPKDLGVDISGFTNTKDLGFLGKNKTEPWGQIFDIKEEKIMVGENDTVHVKMFKDNPRPGDIFTVYSVSGPVKHPLDGKKIGYIHSFKGLIEIEEAQQGFYAAKIKESSRAIQEDDFLMPYRYVPSCITPVPCNSNITANIVASKDELNLLAQYSIVYIDAGSYDNIQRGNIFEVKDEREPKMQNWEKIPLPSDVVGKILILDTTEETSTGVVFWSSKNFTNGAKIRPHTWGKDPKGLAHLPTCPIK